MTTKCDVVERVNGVTECTLSFGCRASPEEVFAFMLDVARYPSLFPEMVRHARITEGQGGEIETDITMTFHGVSWRILSRSTVTLRDDGSIVVCGSNTDQSPSWSTTSFEACIRPAVKKHHRSRVSLVTTTPSADLPISRPMLKMLLVFVRPLVKRVLNRVGTDPAGRNDSASSSGVPSVCG